MPMPTLASIGGWLFVPLVCSFSLLSFPFLSSRFGEGTPVGTRLPLPDESIILYRKPEEAKSGKGNKKKRAAAEAAAASAAAKNTV